MRRTVIVVVVVVVIVVVTDAVMTVVGVACSLAERHELQGNGSFSYELRRETWHGMEGKKLQLKIMAFQSLASIRAHTVKH